MVEGRWSIVVHGGARTIAHNRRAANRSGCAAAAQAGADILRRGGSAIEAVKVAVCILEDDPTFNAGSGSVGNAAGEIELDAGIMDGSTLAIGAVAAVSRIYNPVEVAAGMLDAAPILLVGAGAEAFARSRGLPLAATPLAPLPAADPGHDTVGCVALDQTGHFAAATSTGGLAGTMPGRVGDAPLPGCGFYAEDGIGGVSLSGDGEAIARTLLAARVMRALETKKATSAARAIFKPLERMQAEAGAIVIDAAGGIGLAHNSDHLAVAYAASDLKGVKTLLHQNELDEPDGQ
ncbi:MAG: asparaginase [Sphingopyxis sp.]|uniref:isoaspartyl peptidase/L-asparaginase family protein n=1 Tax=Sphingopyxis sp. TaxID=1908224 RepID=UPI003D80DE31